MVSHIKPEERARESIDAQLIAAGWLVQDRRHLNLHAGPGVALCETDVEGGFADYVFFVDGKAAAALEAKAAGTPLVGVAEQSELYARAAGGTQHRPRRMNRNSLNRVEFHGFNCGEFATIGGRSHQRKP